LLHEIAHKKYIPRSIERIFDNRDGALSKILKDNRSVRYKKESEIQRLVGDGEAEP